MLPPWWRCSNEERPRHWRGFVSMVAPSAPRDARSKTPPGPEGSNGIDRRGRRGQPAGLPPPSATLPAAWTHIACAMRPARHEHPCGTPRLPPASGPWLVVGTGRGDGARISTTAAPLRRVSIDAGVEVSRRGYHPSTTTNDQPRSQAAAEPIRKQQPSRRVIRSGRGDGTEILAAAGYAWRGQQAGLPPFYDDERSASIAGSGCAYKKATATPACHSFRPWRRHRDPCGGRLCLARSAGGVTTLLDDERST